MLQDAERKFKSTRVKKPLVWNVPITKATFTILKCRKLFCEGIGTGNSLQRKKYEGSCLLSFSIIAVSHRCLSLPAQVFPFILFFPGLPYEYSFRLLKCVMQIFISCMNHEKNPQKKKRHTTHKWKKISTPLKKQTPKKPPDHPWKPTAKTPRRQPLCGYFILLKRKSYMSNMKNQWVGFVCIEIPRLTPLHKRRKCKCWHVVLRQCTESFASHFCWKSSWL